MAGLGNFEIENRVFDYTRFFVIIFLQKDFYFFKWLVFDCSNNIFDIDGIFEVLGNCFLYFDSNIVSKSSSE